MKWQDELDKGRKIEAQRENVVSLLPQRQPVIALFDKQGVLAGSVPSDPRGRFMALRNLQ